MLGNNPKTVTARPSATSRTPVALKPCPMINNNPISLIDSSASRSHSRRVHRQSAMLQHRSQRLEMLCVERTHPVLRSAGQSVRARLLSLHCWQVLAPRASATKPEGTRLVGANDTAHPPLAASGPYLPSLSLATLARHHLRQEPYAGNPLVRIRAGGGQQWPSLPRHTPSRCQRHRAFRALRVNRQDAIKDVKGTRTAQRQIQISGSYTRARISKVQEARQ